MNRGSLTDPGILASIYLGVVGAAFAGILPMMVGMFAGQPGFGPRVAGYLVSFELGAQLFGVATFIGLRRLPWKGLAAAAIVVMTIGNLGSAFTMVIPVIVGLRIIVGIGEGVARSLCYAVLSDAIQPGRALSVYASAQMFISAAGVFAVPFLASRYGWQGPFIILSVFCISAIWVVGFIPNLGRPRAKKRSRRRRLEVGVQLGIVGIFVYFVGQGALWAYLEQLGVEEHIPATIISTVLSISMFAGLGGAFFVSVYAHRAKAMVGLMVGAGMSLVSIALLLIGNVTMAFAVGVCIFNFAWTFTFPFQFELIAKSDYEGRAGAIIPAVDSLALAIGPAIVASLFPVFGVGASPYICLIGVIASCLFFVPLATPRGASVDSRRTG